MPGRQPLMLSKEGIHPMNTRLPPRVRHRRRDRRARRHRRPAGAVAEVRAEKCYGIAKAGRNDCQTANSSCAGTSKRDGQGDAWVYVPQGHLRPAGKRQHFNPGPERPGPGDRVTRGMTPTRRAGASGSGRDRAPEPARRRGARHPSRRCLGSKSIPRTTSAADPRSGRSSAMRRDYPAVVHAVGLSLGGADGVDRRISAASKSLVERLEPAFVSEHLAWSQVDGAYLNHLLPLPYEEESSTRCAVVSRNTGDARSPILIENPSLYLRFATLAHPGAGIPGGPGRAAPAAASSGRQQHPRDRKFRARSRTRTSPRSPWRRSGRSI